MPVCSEITSVVDLLQLRLHFLLFIARKRNETQRLYYTVTTHVLPHPPPFQERKSFRSYATPCDTQ